MGSKQFLPTPEKVSNARNCIECAKEIFWDKTIEDAWFILASDCLILASKEENLLDGWTLIRNFRTDFENFIKGITDIDLSSFFYRILVSQINISDALPIYLFNLILGKEEESFELFKKFKKDSELIEKNKDKFNFKDLETLSDFQRESDKIEKLR